MQQQSMSKAQNAMHRNYKYLMMLRI